MYGMDNGHTFLVPSTVFLSLWALKISLRNFFSTLLEGTRLLDFWVHYPTLPYSKLTNHYSLGPDYEEKCFISSKSANTFPLKPAPHLSSRTTWPESNLNLRKCSWSKYESFVKGANFLWNICFCLKFSVVCVFTCQRKLPPHEPPAYQEHPRI